MDLEVSIATGLGDLDDFAAALRAHAGRPGPAAKA